MDYIYNPNTGELYHHGVKGMKWGVRKVRYNESIVSNRKKPGLEKYERDRGINYGGKRRTTSSALNEAGNIGTMAGKAIRKGIEKAQNPERKAANEAKKQAKQQATKAAVKDYSKRYNEASRASDLADAKWDSVKEQYKSLGKNRVERMLNAGRNKTAAQKAYNKAFDEASAASDLADAKWNEAKAAYVNTGRNRVMRVLNNARYS